VVLSGNRTWFQKPEFLLWNGARTGSTVELGEEVKITYTAGLSSAIQAHGYDPATKTARIQFTNARIHEFPNVEPGEYQEFADAESLGRHFNEHWRGRDHVRVR
jgi:hypothetical protein